MDTWIDAVKMNFLITESTKIQKNAKIQKWIKTAEDKDIIPHRTTVLHQQRNAVNFPLTSCSN